MKLIISPVICFLLFFFSSTRFSQKSNLYIRLNQVGFLNDDIKSGVIISEEELPFKQFYIIDQNSNTKVFEGNLNKTNKNYGKFNHNYSFDFSEFKEYGKFTIKVGDNLSNPFEIGLNLYNPVVDSLMLFFKIQRCGPTDPLMHEKCHLSDATEIFGLDSTVDVTGGWHDAGDYIKFFSTTALTTYMLLFAYDFDNEKFGFDSDKNNVPDILEEAKVGLDWLLRSNFSDSLFIIQVQDERDHEVGWRMPENDSLQFNRPAFLGISKNFVGIYSAVMALASRIWSEKFFNDEFANKCLTSAIQKYSLHQIIINIDTVNSTFYKDKTYLGKIALGAVELYNATADDNYLNDAITFGDSAKSDHWWSWGDINSLAYYKLSKIVPHFSDKIRRNLSVFNEKMDSSIFNEAANYTWGTTTTLLGTALQAILYKSLTGSNKFDSLIVFQRDCILGRNPWGLSFINGIGVSFPKHIHSQIAFFNGGKIPGALTAGGAPISILNNYKISRSDSSYSYFNTETVEYFDDWNDYITNEPTIFGNATALFVFGYFTSSDK